MPVGDGHGKARPGHNRRAGACDLRHKVAFSVKSLDNCGFVSSPLVSPSSVMLKASVKRRRFANCSQPPPGGKPMNTIRKFIVAAAAAAVATSLLPPSSFAKAHKAKAPRCSFGQACTDKATGASKSTGWMTAQRCSWEGKMYRDVFPCYAPGGACPAATCKSAKK